jgi:hypothetical protein
MRCLLRVNRRKPTLLRELAAALAETDLPSGQPDLGRIERMVPRAVTRHVLIRLARHDPSGSALARAVAVLGFGTLPLYAAALVADILAAVRPLAFVHPLLRESCTQS